MSRDLFTWIVIIKVYANVKKMSLETDVISADLHTLENKLVGIEVLYEYILAPVNL